MQRLLYDQNFPSPWVPFHDKDQPETVGSLNKPWVGFKAMYNHVYCNRHLQRWIEEKGFTILHLVRENLLKQYVSLRRMKVTGKSHSCTKVTKATPVAIDIHRLEHHIEKMMKRIEYFRNIYATNHPYMEFTYESYFRNPVKIRKQITTFMDVPDEEMQDSKNQKTSTNVLEREIANATEVVRWIEKTPYAHFLEAYS
ncbi:hypothetical protein [Desulfovibrio inopinatus]|uniref:hypothetical protein n=1 Tax=Desulfovibrio inopinatus TaxID=102109 RepID=UPI0012EB4D8B|nr:hypothetical protein [Desulfovibrio inopinatus]